MFDNRRALVVDDERTFDLPGWEVVHARTSKEAMSLIEEFEWNAIFLDHDLGGADTTISVARYMKEIGFNGLVYIHTQNPVGRKNLKLEFPFSKDIYDPKGFLA